MNSAIGPRRPVRSFVRREGRMTPAQRRALDRLWPRYGVEPGPEPLDFARLFGRRAPVIAEIGFGDGAALAAMAAAHPENDYLGIEVYAPGVGSLLRRLDEHGAANVQVVHGDAAEVFARHIPGGSLAAVHVFFPDPWPKKRHHKRRLLDGDFLRLLATRLSPGGHLHVATDWDDYARFVLDAAAGVAGLVNRAGPGAYSTRPAYRPVTKYERRGRRLGHPVRDLIFERRAAGE